VDGRTKGIEKRREGERKRDLFLQFSDDYKLSPLYPEVHLPLSHLGLLLHGVSSWNSKPGMNLRICLWSSEKCIADRLIHLMTSMDLEYVKAIVHMQDKLIPKIKGDHYEIASLLNLETGNKEYDF